MSPASYDRTLLIRTLQKVFIPTLLTLFAFTNSSSAAEPAPLPRCQILPLANREVSLQIDGIERTRWHFGDQYTGPFFFPFNGPSGSSLTRIGHPGDSGHDHHRSVWFAHHKVNGHDFWSHQPSIRIRQTKWLAYHDSDQEARLAVRIQWIDANDEVQLEQELVAAVIPGEAGEWSLELQAIFTPRKEASAIMLEKTNFGFLAVRVAKSISEYFGGGTLTSSTGGVHEPAIFGNPASWVDYSGTVPASTGPDRSTVTEGITYFDHPANPRFPSKWHVREDGWMGASLCFDEGLEISHQQPLTLRYLLHSHRGSIDSNKANAIAKAFATRPGFEVVKSKKKHQPSDQPISDAFWEKTFEHNPILFE